MLHELDLKFTRTGLCCDCQHIFAALIMGFVNHSYDVVFFINKLAGDAIQKIIDVLPKVYQTLFAHCAKEFSADMKSQKPPEWFLKAVGQAGTRQLWLGSVSCYLLFILRAQTIL